MEWLQLLYVGVGSFFGFLSAIGTEALFVKYREKIDIKKAKMNLIDELLHIYSLISGNEESKKIIHYCTPIWDAVISTGSILIMLKEDEKLYDELLIIYSHLSTHQRLETDSQRDWTSIATLRTNIVSKIKKDFPQELKEFQEKKGDSE